MRAASNSIPLPNTKASKGKPTDRHSSWLLVLHIGFPLLPKARVHAEIVHAVGVELPKPAAPNCL